jgi:hypothetical protein
LQIRGENVEVEKFTYLGSEITRDGGIEIDVKICIQQAYSAFIQLYKIWKTKEISTATKLQIF